VKSIRAGHWLRLARSIAVAVAIAYVVFLSVMFVVMSQPPQRFGQIMRYFPMPAMMIVPFEPMWNAARGGELRVGDEAPDFTLPRSDKSGTVQLSSLRGKPVVLVFGSYT
jgi:cytochrome oxidase Cu insertion factor (SCO1/SenC/PrrC family)